MRGEGGKSSQVRAGAMRPTPITRQRCLDRAAQVRAAALAASTPAQRADLLHMANAYEALAQKAG